MPRDMSRGDPQSLRPRGLASRQLPTQPPMINHPPCYCKQSRHFHRLEALFCFVLLAYALDDCPPASTKINTNTTIDEHQTSLQYHGITVIFSILSKSGFPVQMCYCAAWFNGIVSFQRGP